MIPRFSRLTVFLLPALLVLGISSLGFGQAAAKASDDLTGTDISSAKLSHMAVAPRGHRNGQGHARFGIPNIDSLVNFNKHYQASGFDVFGNRCFGKWLTAHYFRDGFQGVKRSRRHPKRLLSHSRNRSWKVF